MRRAGSQSRNPQATKINAVVGHDGGVVDAEAAPLGAGGCRAAASRVSAPPLGAGGCGAAASSDSSVDVRFDCVDNRPAQHSQSRNNKVNSNTDINHNRH